MNKRLIALFLTVTMLFSVLPVSVLAKVPDPVSYTGSDTIHNYVALGDSIPAGNSRPGYYRGITGFLAGAYPTILKTAFNAKDDIVNSGYSSIEYKNGDGTIIIGASQNELDFGKDIQKDSTGDNSYVSHSFAGARCAMRTHEMRVLVDEEYKGDKYTSDFFSTTWGNPMSKQYLVDHRGQYQNAIKNADLITLEFGSNEIFGTLNYYFEDLLNQYASGESDMQADILAELETIRSGQDGIQRLSALIALAQKFGVVYDFIDTMNQTVAEFKANWDVIMQKIFELNNKETLKVVAIGLYLPHSRLTQNKLVDDTIRYYMDEMDTYMRNSTEKYAKEYLYADVSELTKSEFKETDPDNETNKEIGCALDGAHPNAAGHRYIANQIITVLNNNATQPADNELSSSNELLIGIVTKTVDRVSDLVSKTLDSLVVRIEKNISAAIKKFVSNIKGTQTTVNEQTESVQISPEKGRGQTELIKKVAVLLKDTLGFMMMNVLTETR